MLHFSIETEYDAKLQAMNDRHALELASLTDSTITISYEAEQCKSAEVSATAAAVNYDGEIPEEDGDNNNDTEREKKQLRARRKREKQKEKDRQRQLELARETLEAGPSLRQLEIEQLHQHLAPLHLKIEEVKADGHCLYRAVASQCHQTYSEIRKFRTNEWNLPTLVFAQLLLFVGRELMREHVEATRG
jgi:OTU domain-containing protein 6